MRRFLATMAGIVVTMALVATPAIADERADSMRATAAAVCNERASAKNVTIAIEVDGKTTKQKYTCAQVLGTAAGSKVPVATDFKVGIDVLKKQCFASAGCSIAYKINATYDGSTALDPSKSYTVVYDVAGAESPITANFTIQGTKVNSQQGTAYLPNKDAKLHAMVTSVLEGG